MTSYQQNIHRHSNFSVVDNSKNTFGAPFTATNRAKTARTSGEDNKGTFSTARHVNRAKTSKSKKKGTFRSRNNWNKFWFSCANWLLKFEILQIYWKLGQPLWKYPRNRNWILGVYNLIPTLVPPKILQSRRRKYIPCQVRHQHQVKISSNWLYIKMK